MANHNILVAIPCYKCAPQIKRVISKFDKALLERLGKVMIIDNGSPDDTRDSAIEAVKKNKSKKFEIFKNDGNYNLGGSHKVAFNRALGEGYTHVAILHGDDQAEAQELNLLIDEIEKHPDTTILGGRFMSKSRLKGYSAIRKWGNRGLNMVFTLVSFNRTQDLGSGINIFRMEDLKDTRYLGFGNTLTFNIDLLLDYYRKKTKLKLVPITWSEEDQVSNARAVEIGTVALKKLFLWRLGFSSYNKGLAEQDYSSTRIYPK